MKPVLITMTLSDLVQSLSHALQTNGDTPLLELNTDVIEDNYVISFKLPVQILSSKETTSDVQKLPSSKSKLLPIDDTRR